MMKFIDFIKTNSLQKSLVILCGLPATGKTTLGEIISKRWGHVIIRSDIIRLQVFRDKDIFDERFASDMKNRNLIYDVMFKLAEDIIGQNKDTLLDATFIKQEQRIKSAQIALKFNINLYIMETICPEDICIKRILSRSRDEYTSNAITPEAYYNNKNAFEKVDIRDIKERYPNLNISHLVVDTSIDGFDNWKIIQVNKL